MQTLRNVLVVIGIIAIISSLILLITGIRIVSSVFIYVVGILAIIAAIGFLAYGIWKIFNKKEEV
jgi:hypothetical protein